MGNMTARARLFRQARTWNVVDTLRIKNGSQPKLNLRNVSIPMPRIYQDLFRV